MAAMGTTTPMATLAGWLRPPPAPSPPGLIGVAVEVLDTVAEVDGVFALGVVVPTTTLVVVTELGGVTVTMESDVVGSGVEVVGTTGVTPGVVDVEVVGAAGVGVSMVGVGVVSAGGDEEVVGGGGWAGGVEVDGAVADGRFADVDVGGGLLDTVIVVEV